MQNEASARSRCARLRLAPAFVPKGTTGQSRHPAEDAPVLTRFQLLGKDQPVHAVRRCLSNRSRIGRKSAASVHARESNAAFALPPRPTTRLPRNADINSTGPASRKSTRSTGRPVTSASFSTKARPCLEPGGPFASTPTSRSLSGLAVPAATDPNTVANRMEGSAANRDATFSSNSGSVKPIDMAGLWHVHQSPPERMRRTAGGADAYQQLPLLLCEASVASGFLTPVLSMLRGPQASFSWGLPATGVAVAT
jgi:hypothetical protein